MAQEPELTEIANFVRQMTGVPGVCVLVLDADACPFGYAFALEHASTLRAALPDKLREVAALLAAANPPPEPAS